MYKFVRVVNFLSTEQKIIGFVLTVGLSTDADRKFMICDYKRCRYSERFRYLTSVEI